MIKDLFMKRLLNSLVAFILVFGVTTIATFAWFVQQEQRGILISTGDFVVELFVSFDGDVVGPLSPFYDSEKKAVIINAYDENSPNYVGNMKVSMTITPIIAARVRLKILDEWELTRYYIDETGSNPIPPIKQSIVQEPLGYPYLPYSVLKFDPLFDGRTDSQFFIYYNHILPKGVETTIVLIDGGIRYPVRNNPVFYEECFVYLDVYLDIVQANRAFDIWDIDLNFFD